jgi:hypothetical protein
VLFNFHSSIQDHPEELDAAQLTVVSGIAKYHTRPDVKQRLGSDSCYLGSLGGSESALDSLGVLAV